nr:ribonuclease H-like domain-containing protein [Tanacetum cinerariifolium]
MGSSKPLELGFSILHLILLGLQIIGSLHQEFAMTDLGPFNYFLGISVTRDSSGLFLYQKKYVVEIFEKENMVNCNPSQTSVDTESKLGVGGDLISDPTMYRSLAADFAMRIRPGVPLLEDRLQEAEYRGVANDVAETCWLHNLLRELLTPMFSATLVYCDNVSAVYLSCNPV